MKKRFRNKILLFFFFLAAMYIIINIIKPPLSQTFEYIPDEGFNLMKSSLFLKGYLLYKEIWSDQPPLFTVILSYWLKLFGLSVYHGRILILIFSTILLWAFYQIIKIQWGVVSAFMSVIFLLLSSVYIRLSISIMVGIPSLAFAMLSIYCSALYRKLCLKHLLVLSGIFMALSLQVKLFTSFLIPVILLEIAQAKGVNLKGKKERGRSLLSILPWFSSLFSVYFAVTIIFFRFDFSMFIQQLLNPHLRRIIAPANYFSLICKMILTDYDIALLALIGIILLIKQKKWHSLLPVLWLVLIIAILLNYNPVRYHYYPLVSIPMCWLAAISFGEFFHTDIRQKRSIKKNKYSPIDMLLRWLTAGLIILVILRIPLKYHRMYREVEGKTSLQEQAVVNLLMQYKTHTRWIITDRPIFAFYADMLVPPELAVTSTKRNFTDSAAQDYFIDKLEKYKAKLILLDKVYFYGPRVISYIERNYDNIYQSRIPLYVWNIDNNIEISEIKRFIGHICPLVSKYCLQSVIRRGIPHTNIRLYIYKDVYEHNGAPQ